MIRAAIYVRISLDRSGESAGVRRQEEDARKLAAGRAWTVTEVFRDNDRSATSGKARPGWDALLAAIAVNEIDALVAYSSSRLYRRPADLGRLIELVRVRPGFEIATVASGRIDLSTADGRMVAGILAEVDQAEVDKLRERVTRARKQRVEAGFYGGGKRPFGHDATVLAIVPAEADAIRNAAERLLRGEPLRAILREWDKRGIRTTRGHAWSASAFRWMMVSPRLAGIHPETGDRAKWPAIITRRDHADLVALFDDPTRLRSARGDRYLLTGLVWCARCEGRMTGNPQRGRRRYICRSTGELHMTIDAANLESYVVDRAAEQPDIELRQVLDPRAESGPILAQLDDVDARIATWSAEAAEAGLRAGDIRAGSAALRAEREALEAQLATVEKTRWIDPDKTWGELFGPETREWLDVVIDRVVVSPAVRPQFDPARVAIAWR